MREEKNGGKWKTRSAYQSGIPEPRRTPAQGPDDRKARRNLYKGLAKAESSALIQIRTEKIRFVQFYLVAKCQAYSQPAANLDGQSRI